MGLVMFRCPETGRAVSTGIAADRAAFRAMPVFFSRTLCPHCRVTHEWFARDAWVCDSVPAEPEHRGKQRVAHAGALGQFPKQSTSLPRRAPQARGRAHRPEPKTA